MYCVLTTPGQVYFYDHLSPLYPLPLSPPSFLSGSHHTVFSVYEGFFVHCLIPSIFSSSTWHWFPLTTVHLFSVSESASSQVPINNEWIKKLRYIYTTEYYSAIKKRKSYLLWLMDGPGEYYAKWNKIVTERKVQCDLTYRWILMNKIN